MKKNNTKIAVVIHNYIQCLNILPGVEELIRLGYSVDLYSLKTDDKMGFQDLFDDTIKYLKMKGYKVYTKSKKVIYKILLEPYDSEYLKIDAKYNIRYRYGQITAKPNIVYQPSFFIKYDCVLCSGKYESRLLNNYTNTAVVPDLKYIDFKKKNYHKNKKVLLYLPTYGKESSIELIINEINKLKEDYYIIVKIHHGTSFLIDEKERINKIKECADEFYDLHKSLKDLLEISNVVLTDNSASLFDAIYNNVPVAVFTNDINQNKMGSFNTIQYELNKEGILPYTNKASEIKKILEEAQSNKIKNKQKKWNDNNFYHSNDPLKDFIKIIDNYLNDEIDLQSYLLRKKIHKDHSNALEQVKVILNEKQELINKLNLFSQKFNEISIESNKLNEKIKELNDKLEKINNENTILKNELLEYKKRKLYKISTKIYKMQKKG